MVFTFKIIRIKELRDIKFIINTDSNFFRLKLEKIRASHGSKDPNSTGARRLYIRTDSSLLNVRLFTNLVYRFYFRFFLAIQMVPSYNFFIFINLHILICFLSYMNHICRNKLVIIATKWSIQY